MDQRCQETPLSSVENMSWENLISFLLLLFYFALVLACSLQDWISCFRIHTLHSTYSNTTIIRYKLRHVLNMHPVDLPYNLKLWSRGKYQENRTTIRLSNSTKSFASVGHRPCLIDCKVFFGLAGLSQLAQARGISHAWQSDMHKGYHSAAGWSSIDAGSMIFEA